jgi:ubiquinone/menaquinone biosynthesis C-methylase UbiE
MTERPDDNPAKPDFWESRYREGNSGWDIAQPAPPFVDLMAQPDAPAPGSLIVPGCGRGHDAIFFAQRGFSVVGVDFAHEAITDARRAAERAGVKVDFVEHDLFTLPSSYDHRFDYVIEHTCFAAIPPTSRPDYVKLVTRLIAPGGLYIAIFFAHGKPGGPPFNTTADEIRALFSPHFSIEKLEPPTRSVEQRAGQELFALMRPLAGGSRT